MFIPIGLSSIMFRFPWITFVILFLVFFMSLKKFKDVDMASQELLSSPTRLELIRDRAKAMVEACSGVVQFSQEDCRKIKAASANHIYSLTDPILNLQRPMGKRPSMAEQNLLRHYQKYLMDDQSFERMILPVLSAEMVTQYQSRQRQLRLEVEENFKLRGLLSRNTFSFKSLLIAQFIHGGWMHLLGNLLIFLFLAIHVELRVGPILYAFIYLASGFFGLGLQVFLYHNPEIFLVGASANITGVAGAYTVLFWKKRLQVLFYYLFYYRFFWVPVSLFFPVLFLSADLVGALNSAAGGVAHLAHLGGFAIGALAALIIQRWQNLPANFCFPEELKYYRQMANENPAAAIALRLQILQINPENWTVHEEILQDVPDQTPWGNLGLPQQTYFCRYFAAFFLHLKNHSRPHLAKHLDQLQNDWPFQEIFRGVDAKTLRSALQDLKSEGALYPTLIIYQALFSVHQKYRSEASYVQDYNELLQKFQVGISAHSPAKSQQAGHYAGVA